MCSQGIWEKSNQEPRKSQRTGYIGLQRQGGRNGGVLPKSGAVKASEVNSDRHEEERETEVSIQQEETAQQQK